MLDFVNTADEIREAFEPYYEATILDEEINPNLIYDTRKLMRDFGLYSDGDIEKFLKLFLKKGKQNESDLGKMASLLKPVVDKFKALEEEKRFEYKKTIRNFVKWYSYITQISRMFDKQLHEEFTFCQYLEKLLPRAADNINVDLEDKLKLEFYKLEKEFKGSISLVATQEKQTLINPKTLRTSGRIEQRETLDTIIVRINDKYNGIFTDADIVIVEVIYDTVFKSENRLKAYALKNDETVFTQSIFPEVFQRAAQECYMNSVGGFSKLFEDKAYYQIVMEAIAREAYRELRTRKY